MKAKVKFDSAQLKQFFLHHVEKIVFGGFIVAFLLICSAAFKLKPYDKTPDQLKALAAKVSQEVESKTPPEKIEGLANVPNFSNLGAVGPTPVDPRFYAIAPLSLPYELRQMQRKEPKFFPLEEPLVYCGYGGIAIGEEGQVQRMPGSFGAGGGMDYSSDMPPPGMPPPEMMNSGTSPEMMNGGMPPPEMMMGGAAGGRGRRNARSRRNTRKKEEKKPPPPPKPRITEKFVLQQPPSGSQVEGRYWICLVGAIPYWRQLGEYQDTFRDSRFYDAKRDYPRFALPVIERAEITRQGQGDWQALDVEAALEDLDQWAAEYPDVVDPRFLDPFLTEPLPPLVFANHDKEKVNHPRTTIEEEKPLAVEPDQGKKKVKRRGLSGHAGRSRTGGSQYNMSSGSMPPGGRDAYAGMASGMGPGMGMGGPGMGADGRRAGPVVEHRLFRFFDFTVDPGKTYRYRVKLVLNNPNAGVPPRFLDKYEYGKGATREADWSPPSPQVTVIAGNRLLAGGVSPGRSEPSGKVLVKLFDAAEAAEIRRIFDINRGSVLNEREAEIGLPDPKTPDSKRASTVDIETNAVVLDMFGGEKLPGVRSTDVKKEPPKVPGHILVLDNDGAIKILQQAGDAGLYETEALEAANQSPPKEREAAGPGASGGGAGFDNFNFGGIQEKKKPRGRR